jgi:hypothetical protein
VLDLKGVVFNQIPSHIRFLMKCDVSAVSCLRGGGHGTSLVVFRPDHC